MLCSLQFTALYRHVSRISERFCCYNINRRTPRRQLPCPTSYVFAGDFRGSIEEGVRECKISKYTIENVIIPVVPKRVPGIAQEDF